MDADEETKYLENPSNPTLVYIFYFILAWLLPAYPKFLCLIGASKVE
jgi:hypothetical protein